MTRIRRVESERDLEVQVDEFITKGYKVQQQGQYSTKVKQKDFGRAPVHVFVFIFALLVGAVLAPAIGIGSGAAWVFAFLANAVYVAYSWISAEVVVIKVEEEERVD